MAVWRLLVAWLAVRLAPFSLLVRTLGVRKGGDSGGSRAETCGRVAKAVKLAARNLPLEMNCLPQGLTACWLLQSLGIEPELHYGVQAVEPGIFTAHVWVEVDGQGIIGHENGPRTFSTLAVFPGTPHQ